MAEYIERETLLTNICDDMCGLKYTGVCENCRVVALIADTPAADVAPVVYCKDCKYADTERRNATEKRYTDSIIFCRNSNLCNDESLAMWPVDFCSYGERKETE